MPIQPHIPLLQSIRVHFVTVL